jgi:hypothetical protein
MSQETALLFAYPPQRGERGLELWSVRGRIPDTNIEEIFFELRVKVEGDYVTYRIPHDLDLLYDRLRPQRSAPV